MHEHTLLPAYRTPVESKASAPAGPSYTPPEAVSRLVTHSQLFSSAPARNRATRSASPAAARPSVEENATARLAVAHASFSWGLAAAEKKYRPLEALM